jgi:hypothetical protein
MTFDEAVQVLQAEYRVALYGGSRILAQRCEHGRRMDRECRVCFQEWSDAMKGTPKA